MVGGQWVILMTFLCPLRFWQIWGHKIRAQYSLSEWPNNFLKRENMWHQRAVQDPQHFPKGSESASLFICLNYMSKDLFIDFPVLRVNSRSNKTQKMLSKYCKKETNPYLFSFPISTLKIFLTLKWKYKNLQRENSYLNVALRLKPWKHDTRHPCLEPLLH